MAAGTKASSTWNMTRGTLKPPMTCGAGETLKRLVVTMVSVLGCADRFERRAARPRYPAPVGARDRMRAVRLPRLRAGGVRVARTVPARPWRDVAPPHARALPAAP